MTKSEARFGVCHYFNPRKSVASAVKKSYSGSQEQDAVPAVSASLYRGAVLVDEAPKTQRQSAVSTGKNSRYPENPRLRNLMQYFSHFDLAKIQFERPLGYIEERIRRVG